MIIAFASGKGGTGKTSLSVAFTLSLDKKITYLDCDVEEPNAHFFIKPEIHETKEINVLVPSIDNEKCTACGVCSNVCQFNAIVQIKQKVNIFQELCHSCGGCALACPTKAITETPHPIGTITKGTKNEILFSKGELHIGKAMSPPVIRKIKEETAADCDTIIDCPPGTSCPMITAIQGADYIVLVTEPTPFGLHDLSLAVDTVKAVGIPCGVIINRTSNKNTIIENYCKDKNIPVLLEIPEDRSIAEAYSTGKTMLETNSNMIKKCKSLYSKILNQVGKKA